MRFLIGEFAHESNCFSPRATTRKRFEEGDLFEGDALIDHHAGKKTVLGGFIDVARRDGHVLVPSIAASTFPSGPVDADFYTWVRDRLIETARRGGALDGVLLALHGGMSITGEGPEALDPEGDIVAALRCVLGPDVPIAVVLDLHSDTTDRLLANTALTLAYNEEPHRDGYDRGVEAATLLPAICRGDVTPVAVRHRVPMLLPAINMATDKGPMHELHKLRAELEAVDDVIDISIHAGFYGSDQPEAGFSVVCTTDGNEALAHNLAQRVGDEAWAMREAFLIDLVSPEEAVARALSADEPIALIDEADDPAGGAPCDSVVIVRAMIEGGIEHGGMSTIFDAEVARTMAAAGEDAEVTVSLGAKTDDLHGQPIDVTGRVAKISREPVPVDSWSGKTIDVGIVGVLDVRGVLIVVTERKLVTENIDIFALLGFDVCKMQAVGFKGLTLHVRQALADRLDTFLPIDGIGITHPDVRKLGPYRHVRRPVWPLDEF